MVRKLLSLLFATAGAAAVLCAGAWAGGAFSRAEAAQGARPSRATDEQSYPKMADGEIPVGDSLVVNGQPMQLSLFVTEDPAVKVIEYYRAAFEARALIPIANVEQGIGHVSVFDPEDGYQRFITALPQGAGQTLVMVGVTNPRKAPRFTKAAKSMPFPVPAEERGFLGYESQDGAVRSQNGQFASSLTAEAALAFYRAALQKQGYTEDTNQSSGAVAVFGKGPASITVAVQALEDKSGSMVFVNRTEGNER